MRYFAADQLLKLSIAPADLPVPWVIPWQLRRHHKDRLAALLARALRTFDDRIGYVELRWAERHLLEERRLRVPRPSLVRWRVEAVPPVAPEAAIQEASRLNTGFMLFDFDAETDVPAFAWLGPLKVQVLYRLIDLVMDGLPVDEPRAITVALGEAAETLASPIELIDFADALIEETALGQNMATARAEAVARVLAQRFEPEGDDREPADAFVATLAETARGGALSAETRAVLYRAGLMDRNAPSPSPMVDALSDVNAARRVMARVIGARGLTVPPDRIAPSWFPKETAPSEHPPPMPPTQAQEPTLPVDAPEALHDVGAVEGRIVTAIAELEAGRPERAASLLTGAMRAREDERWSVADLRAAATILMRIVAIFNERRTDQRDTEEFARIASLADTAALLAERASDTTNAVNALLATAYFHRMAYQSDPAERALERALSLAEGAGDQRQVASCLLALGAVRFHKDNFTGAREAYEAALPLYRAIGDRPGEANVLQATGDLRLRMADLAGAREAYEAALPLYRAIGDRLGEANVLRATGDLRIRMDDLATARETYEAALPLYRAIGDRLGEVNVLKAIGDLRFWMADLAGARETYEAVLPLYRALGDRVGVANVLQATGDLRLRAADLAGAREAYEAALPLYRAIGARLGEANVLKATGDLRLRTDDLVAAREAYEAALPLYRAIGARLGEANTLQAIGDLRLRMDDLAGAREAYEAALPLHHAIGTRLGESNVLRGLAKAAIVSGLSAPPELERSLALAREVQDNHGIWLSLTLKAIGVPPEVAVPQLHDVASRFEDAGLSLEAVIASTLASIFEHTGAVDLASRLRPCLGERAERIVTLAASDPKEAIRALVRELPTS